MSGRAEYAFSVVFPKPMRNINPANNNGLTSPEESSNMFITPAWAQEASDAVSNTTGEGGIMGFLGPIAPILIVFFIFYIVVIRPQNRRMVEHRKSLDNLQKGDKVVTGGGVLATVRKLHGDEEIELEIAPGVIVTALRGTLMSIRETKASHTAEAKK
jgi:preprotein translocase subunit YajC